ncbi:unnamed protein product [Strongylus vulgaris]|uniref:Calponin-homology (CH) domain-containing protein n=1 Tax=Strongylus vulgaris TaxID=40348 RepID=A0A3P7LUC1_STRVU|nr:unnamed protein product [Strongylus vulgaris]
MPVRVCCHGDISPQGIVNKQNTPYFAIMSYRELRNLCEMTRAIGYPRILSLENFRTPNFKLVAELLEWIVKRFDPSATISAEQTTNEQDRVLFIKQAVLLLLQNSRLKLNPRKLYQVSLPE